MPPMMSTPSLLNAGTILRLKPLLRRSSTLQQCTELQTRKLVSVQGPSQFMNGLITNKPDPCKTVYTGFLNPKGRLLFDAFIHPAPTGMVLDVHASQYEAIMAHLNRYKLRNKDVQFTELLGTRVWCAWGGPFPCTQDQDPRLHLLGLRSLSSECPFPYTYVDESEYMKHRLALGVAEGTDFDPGVSLPLEMNMDYLNGIDFHKGCYIGQELTIRTHHQGVVRKRLVPCTVSSPPLVRGAEIVNTCSGKVAGKWYVGIDTLGIALLRFDQISPHSAFAIDTDAGRVAVHARIPDWWPLIES